MLSYLSLPLIPPACPCISLPSIKFCSLKVLACCSVRLSTSVKDCGWGPILRCVEGQLRAERERNADSMLLSEASSSEALVQQEESSSQSLTSESWEGEECHSPCNREGSKGQFKSSSRRSSSRTLAFALRTNQPFDSRERERAHENTKDMQLR